MTTVTATGLIDRYQDYRVRRWLIHENRMAGMLPGWRSRRRRRALVIAVAVAIAALFLVGVLTAAGLPWAPLIWLPGAVVFLPAWTMLRIASQGQDHAPKETLDEWEIAQRNSARSVGLALTQWLTVLPIMYLLLAGAVFPEADAFQVAYGGGAMTLAALLAGGCAPAMILGWTRPDPEPES